MDGVDYHFNLKSTQGNGQARLAFIQSGGVYKVELIC